MANNQGYRNDLTPSHTSFPRHGLQGERKVHVVTHNPSSMSSEHVLYVRCPKLQSGMVIVPGTFELLFDLNSLEMIKIMWLKI